MAEETITPYMFRFVELQYVAGRSDKFYRGLLDKQTNEVITWYGKNGSDGQFNPPVPHETLSDGNDALMKIMQTKMKKGYRVTRSATITCVQKPSEWTLKRQIWNLHDGESILAIPNIDRP